MRPDIAPGSAFPDYELRDHTGTKQRLSALQGADPMVVVLSRGAFCPKDRQQHRLLVEMQPEFKVAYTKIVTISTDNMLEANEMRDGVGARSSTRSTTATGTGAGHRRSTCAPTSAR